MEGRITLHRKLLNNPIASSWELLGFLSYILLRCNHKDKTFYMNMQKVTVKKGQCIISQKKLSSEFGVSRQKVGRMLKCLEHEKIVGILGTTKYTVVTVLNRDKYQGVGIKRTPHATPSGHQTDTNNNDNNENNVDRESLEKLIDIWNKIKLPLKKQLPQIRVTTSSLKEAFNKATKKKKYNLDDIIDGIDNYCKHLVEVNRKEKGGYADHRFSLSKFLKQDNGLDEFINY